jgi:putative ABC transport system substrate-binding protein
MLRRDIGRLLGGALAMAPGLAAAQAVERPRRLGVLFTFDEGDPVGQARLKAFRDGLRRAGWVDGSNVALDLRWARNDRDLVQRHAAELVAAKPDVLVAQNTPATRAFLRLTTTMPIVFCQASDPVGSNLVASLPRPGGNVTGFVDLEASLATKWIELLKEIAPAVTRIGFLHNPATATYAEYYLSRFKMAAPSLGVEPLVVPVFQQVDVAAAFAAQARAPGSGMIVMPEASASFFRAEIFAAAARHSMPVIYPYRYFVEGGGLMSYGIDLPDQYGRAAAYVARILRGERPAGLPVQQPTKFEMTINLRAARELRLAVPNTMLARADDIIE